MATLIPGEKALEGGAEALLTKPIDFTSVVSGKPAFYAMDALASAGQRASLEGNKKFGLTRAAIFFC